MKKATREQTKIHNRQLVLRLIYGEGEISRAAIARATGLTRTTVSSAVAELIEEGLVAEIGVGPSVGGKPPTLVSIVPDFRLLIGIDLANSEFRGAVTDLRGDIHHRISLPINDQDGDTALQLAYTLIDALLAAASKPVMGIGIGTPGLMDAHRRVVRSAVNLDWQDLPLGDLLEEKYDLPIYIANDSQAAALAEFVFGSSTNKPDNLVVIKVGRGIGAGIVLNGQIYYGDSFGAGEIGHVAVVDGGERCRCGNYGCLETVASSQAIIRTAWLRAEQHSGSYYHQRISNANELTTDIVVNAYNAGDEETTKAVTQAGTYLGIAIANIVGILNIQNIVIAGSAARFGDDLVSSACEQMRKSTLTSLGDQTTVTVSEFGDDIVILGAAALLLSNELGLT